MCNEEEELIRYHFGDMSDEESALFRQRLEQNSQLAERLRKLEECLAKCDEDQVEEAPKGLADRTTDSVSDVTLADLHAAENSYKLQRDAGCVSTCRFSMVDASLALFSFLLMGLIVAPAIYQMNATSRRLMCENNMRNIGRAMHEYSEENKKYFPKVGPNQNAGIFTLALADGGYLERDTLKEMLVCPSSELANKVAEKKARVWVPTVIEFLATPCLVSQQAKPYMSGSYAYRIGYIQSKKYKYNKDKRSAKAPLMSDAPGSRCASKGSTNHGENGQNILFEDGHVKYLKCNKVPCFKDNLFVNDLDKPEAGTKWNDTVLVRSEMVPWPDWCLSFSESATSN